MHSRSRSPGLAPASAVRAALVIGTLACGCAAGAPSGTSTRATPPASSTSASATSTSTPARASAKRAPLLPTFVCSVDVCVQSGPFYEVFDEPGLPVRLANVSREDPVESLPAVSRNLGQIVIDLTTTPGESQTHGWVAAILLDDGHTIVGLIDNVIESPGEEIIVATSGDAGETWRRRATLPKPHYTSSVTNLVAESKERWTITLSMPDCAGCGVPEGTYTAVTRDGGVTFTPFTRQD